MKEEEKIVLLQCTLSTQSHSTHARGVRKIVNVLHTGIPMKPDGYVNSQSLQGWLVHMCDNNQAVSWHCPFQNFPMTYFER